MKIFLTGGTGFLGKSLVKSLLKLDHFIYFLSRPNSVQKIDQEIREHKNVKIVLGDITHLDVVFPENNFVNEILEETDAVVHLAALYDLKEKEMPLYLQNVVGTQNILAFVQKMKKKVYFHYTSTIAVAGDYFGTFYEDELLRHQKFNDFYGKTKFNAELYIKNWNEKTSVLKRIYRLGIVVGNSLTGEVDKIDGPYYFLNTLKKALRVPAPILKHVKVIPFPFSESSSLPLIPVDEASRILSILITGPVEIGHSRTYHIISPNPPTIREFITDALAKVKIKSSLIPLPKSKLNETILPFLKIPQEVSDYLYAECEFDQSSLKKDFPFINLKSYTEFKDALFLFLEESIRKGEEK